MKKFLFLISLFIVFIAQSQVNPNPKILNIARIENKPKIDGVLNEDFWQLSEVAKDFVMFRPGFGDKEHAEKKNRSKSSL